MDFDITEQRDSGSGRTFLAAQYRPTAEDLVHLGGSGVHSNHFYMAAPKSTRGVIVGGRAVTRSGKRVARGFTFMGQRLDIFPPEDPLDPYLRESFTPDWTKYAESNIASYWERKLRASDEGKPYPQHHRTTLNLVVGASDDDAWEAENGTLFTVISNLHAVQAWSTTDSRLNAGARFTNVTVPPGATINNCVFQGRCLTTTNDDMRGDWYFNDVDDAADFAGSADVTSRALTTATVSWVGLALGTAYASSPSLAAPLQEVIDRAGWVSGADVMAIGRGKNATNGTGNCYFEAFDDLGTEPPKLDIDYTEAGAVTIKTLAALGVG